MCSVGLSSVLTKRGMCLFMPCHQHLGSEISSSNQLLQLDTTPSHPLVQCYGVAVLQPSSVYGQATVLSKPQRA